MVGGLVLIGAALTIGLFFFDDLFASTPEGLLLHEVKRGPLSLTVKQRGNVESANNQDIVCRVKTGSRSAGGNVFIRWVIPDGSRVAQGDKLIELDDSALKEEARAKRIEVDSAEGNMLVAQQQYNIIQSQSVSDKATAEVAIQLAALDLEKYCGLEQGTLDGITLPELLEMVPTLYATDPETGEYRQLLDDVTGRLKLAEADLQMWRDRVAWTQRMVRMGYLSPTQAQSEESSLASAVEALSKVEREREVLTRFDRRKMITDYASLLAEALRARDRVIQQSEAAEGQAYQDYLTKRSIYIQTLDQLNEVEDQVEFCTIYAPNDGMVVYVVNERSRYGNSDEGMIAEGVAVHEGQKLMQLPDLSQMQVTLKVHESVVMNLRPDVFSDTGFCDALVDVQSALALDPFDRLSRGLIRRPMLTRLEQSFREYDQVKIADGQEATIKVDAVSGRLLHGHVKSVATVATQEWYQPEVKMFPTVVTIDEQVEGLRPNMSAEVTIHLADTVQNVLTLPIQAVVGGPELGDVRECFVMTPSGPEKRSIEIGANNETVVEIRDGLTEGEVVVLNPKVLLGEQTADTPGATGQGESGGAGKGKGNGGGKTGGTKGGKSQG